MSAPFPSCVLYAEDDENDVFFMERAFSKLKLRSILRVVSNGRAAVEYLSGTGEYTDRVKHPLPDLLLLDVKMPELSGLEVLKWARARPDFATLPILLFTSSTQRADIETSQTYRATGYFVKPSNAEHLAGLVRRILNASVGQQPGYTMDMDENQIPGSREREELQS